MLQITFKKRLFNLSNNHNVTPEQYVLIVPKVIYQSGYILNTWIVAKFLMS